MPATRRGARQRSPVSECCRGRKSSMAARRAERDPRRLASPRGVRSHPHGAAHGGWERHRSSERGRGPTADAPLRHLWCAPPISPRICGLPAHPAHHAVTVVAYGQAVRWQQGVAHARGRQAGRAHLCLHKVLFLECAALPPGAATPRRPPPVPPALAPRPAPRQPRSSRGRGKGAEKCNLQQKKTTFFFTPSPHARAPCCPLRGCGVAILHVMSLPLRAQCTGRDQLATSSQQPLFLLAFLRALFRSVCARPPAADRRALP